MKSWCGVGECRPSAVSVDDAHGGMRVEAGGMAAGQSLGHAAAALAVVGFPLRQYAPAAVVERQRYGLEQRLSVAAHVAQLHEFAAIDGAVAGQVEVVVGPSEQSAHAAHGAAAGIARVDAAHLDAGTRLCSFVATQKRIEADGLHALGHGLVDAVAVVDGHVVDAHAALVFAHGGDGVRRGGQHEQQVAVAQGRQRVTQRHLGASAGQARQAEQHGEQTGRHGAQKMGNDEGELAYLRSKSSWLMVSIRMPWMRVMTPQKPQVTSESTMQMMPAPILLR